MTEKMTAELMHEHQAIKRMLAVLEEVADRLDAGEHISADDMDRMVEFIRVFADKCHHGKEEGLLFLELEKAGMPREGGPIAVMKQEHDLGRSYVAGLAEAAERYRAGDSSAGGNFADNARNYAGLLMLHIDKEDNVLYPMANERLSEEQKERLLEGFEKVEREQIGPGKHEEFHRLLEEFEHKYL
jgi:hemerythrin-like domain-containing protein